MRTTWMRSMAVVVLVGGVWGCDDAPDPAGPGADTSLDIAEDVVYLVTGEERTLTVEGAAGLELGFRVRDPEVASLEPGGVLTALAPGMTRAFVRAGDAADSVRVVVSFDDGATGSISFTVGTEHDPLHLTGVSRVYEYLEGDERFTVVTAAPGSRASPELRLEDFFVDQDTMLFLRLEDGAVEGFRQIEPWEVVDRADGLFGLRGREGAVVWMRDPTDPDQAYVFVPVTPMELEIDRSDVPGDYGPATGALVGRVGFEAAGLVVRVDEAGTRIVGQVSDETTRVFAEFDVAQRLHPLGNVRAAVVGGPLPLEPTDMPVPRVGLWQGGLLVNAAGLTADRRLYVSQIWAGTPRDGDIDLDEVRVGEIMDRSALAGERAWMWTESGRLSDPADPGDGPSNLALSTEGTFRVIRYEAPGELTWGLLEATVEAEERLFFGGEPGATQTVTMEILAPVAPASEGVFPHQPAVVVNDDDVHFGPGVVRVGNGPVSLPGWVRETSVHDVEGLEIELRWDGGSASVRSDSEGEFLFTGLHAGTYEVTFELPAGYDLARGQRRVIGPLNLSTDFPMQLPVYLSDAEGNGGLRVFAGTSGLNTHVDGVALAIREAGTSSVVETLVTGQGGVGGGMAYTKLQPGRYEIDVTVPEGHGLEEDQASTVTVELYKGRESFVTVGVVAR